jgi:hypothetical protein
VERKVKKGEKSAFYIRRALGACLASKAPFRSR